MRSEHSEIWCEFGAILSQCVSRTQMSISYGSLDWVFSQWAHFTVH